MKIPSHSNLTSILIISLLSASSLLAAQDAKDNDPDPAPAKDAAQAAASPAAPDNIERAKTPVPDQQRMNILADNTDTEHQVWLQDPQGKFLSLYQVSNLHPTKGALLILHDNGQHPRWPDTVDTIAATLPDYGWTTLTISLPDSKTAHEQDDKSSQQIEAAAIARMQAALNHLSSQGLLNVILIGSGTGAPRGAQLIESLPKPPPTPKGTKASRPIAALVIINDKNPADAKLLSAGFSDPTMPVLDIYFGQEENGSNAAKKRKRLAGRQQMKTYQQIHLAELNGVLSLGENRLSKRIRGFIEKHAKGVAKPLKAL